MRPTPAMPRAAPGHPTPKSKRRHIPQLLVVALLLVGGAPVGAAPIAQADQNPIPLLAYYYIWFDPGSWDRAKVDFPLLGRYSSDDVAVMEQHVRWAQRVGVDGFIVSWKATETLNRRLEQLMEVAAAEGFKLAIIYQGLDFERRPLPLDRIAADLDYFGERYAAHVAFSLFARPLVIWSGTWKFTTEEIAATTGPRRERLLILASERNVEGYERLAPYLDGNAYYWSSVNPQTYPGYHEKLASMSAAVHARAGLWIAPAAPGFDARLLGGTRVVERQDGATLRRQLDAALLSSPDAIGLISWNEFSENSHVEPSQNHGLRYLEVLADVRDGVVPPIPDFDSSEPAGIQVTWDATRVVSLGSLAAIVLASIMVLVRREFGRRPGKSGS